MSKRKKVQRARTLLVAVQREVVIDDMLSMGDEEFAMYFAALFAGEKRLDDELIADLRKIAGRVPRRAKGGTP